MDHHYVPQFYTRRWADSSGKVFCYKRVPNGRIVFKGVVPKGTGFEPDLYATPPAVFWENHAEQVIETEFFSPIDNDAAVVLDKLQSGASSLTDQERTAWALFMNSMLHRHRDEIVERDAAAPKVVAEVRAKWMAAARNAPEDRGRIAEALAGMDLDQLAKSTHRTLMVQAIRDPRALDAMKSLAWEVITVNPDIPLLTTDRPVLVNLGQARPSLEIITMPLSPTRLFVAYPSQWRNPDGSDIDVVDALLKDVTFGHDLLLLNEQRCRFIYTSKKLDDVMSDGRVVRMGLAAEAALKRWES